jgi:hypothetical protein
VKSFKHNRELMEETKMLLWGVDIDKEKVCIVVVFTKMLFSTFYVILPLLLFLFLLFA